MFFNILDSYPTTSTVLTRLDTYQQKVGDDQRGRCAPNCKIKGWMIILMRFVIAVSCTSILQCTCINEYMLLQGTYMYILIEFVKVEYDLVLGYLVGIGLVVF